jgi:hypothetical protein
MFHIPVDPGSNPERDLHWAFSLPLQRSVRCTRAVCLKCAKLNVVYVLACPHRLLTHAAYSRQMTTNRPFPGPSQRMKCSDTLDVCNPNNCEVWCVAFTDGYVTRYVKLQLVSSLWICMLHESACPWEDLRNELPRLASYSARMDVLRNAYKISFWKPERERWRDGTRVM